MSLLLLSGIVLAGSVHYLDKKNTKFQEIMDMTTSEAIQKVKEKKIEKKKYLKNSNFTENNTNLTMEIKMDYSYAKDYLSYDKLDNLFDSFDYFKDDCYLKLEKQFLVQNEEVFKIDNEKAIEIEQNLRTFLSNLDKKIKVYILFENISVTLDGQKKEQVTNDMITIREEIIADINTYLVDKIEEQQTYLLDYLTYQKQIHFPNATLEKPSELMLTKNTDSTTPKLVSKNEENNLSDDLSELLKEATMMKQSISELIKK